MVDPNGEVQMYHSYEPDGQTTLRFRGYIKNPYRYNAERVDKEYYNDVWRNKSDEELYTIYKVMDEYSR